MPLDPSNANWSHAPDYRNLYIPQPFDVRLPAPATFPSPPPNLVTPSISASGSCIPSTPPSNILTRSVKLGNGIVISRTIVEIKQISVPATSFAEDIDRLNQMWDDTSTYWKGDSVVEIDANPIALVHWPEFFKKSGLWSAHKSNWTEWKASQ
jgi:hypothetical protein